MATTPGGLPYPIGTDKVVDGENAIQALAVALDPSELELFRVEAQNLPTGTWTKIDMTSTVVSRGAGLGAVGGAAVATAGRYRALAWGSFSANPSGNLRGIYVGITPPGGAGPTPLSPPTAGGGLTMLTENIQAAAAGAVFQVYLYQDSGTTLTAANVGLNVYRII